ncbi:MAG: YhcH/YjgK/YiaL family protein [Bacteroidales bacterium]|nr:YhcH/YjgK/YiaL family protein [Bacteroidales bacterium]
MKKPLSLFLLLALCACTPKTYLWNESATTVDRAVYDEQYRLNQAEWDAAFAWLSDPASRDLPAGRYDITEKTYAKVQIDSTRAVMNFEDHHKGIDVFYIVSGEELVNVSRPENMTDLVSAYNEAKDVEYYRSSSEFKSVVLKEGDMIILFPSDAHQPMLPPSGERGPIHKLIVKIPFVRAE